MDEQQLQQQIIQLVLAAMQGDQLAQQTIEQVMQAAQQGDQLATQVAQMIQAVTQQIQQLQQQLVQAAKFGAKLNYIKQLRGICPEGYEMQYFKKGGLLCKKCVRKQKMQEGGETPKDAVDAFKKGCKTKKIKKSLGGGKSPLYKRSGWNDYTGEREDTTFRKVNGKEQIVKIDKTDESGTTTTIPYINGKPQKSKTNFETMSGSRLKKKELIERKDEGGEVLQRDGSVKKRLNPLGYSEDTYTVYPYGETVISGKKYIIPDTVRGPEILRPFIHVGRDLVETALQMFGSDKSAEKQSRLKKKNKVSKNEGGNKLPTAEPADERYKNAKKYFRKSKLFPDALLSPELIIDGYKVENFLEPDYYIEREIFYTPFSGNDTTWTETPYSPFVETKSRFYKSIQPLGGKRRYEGDPVIKKRFNEVEKINK